MNKRLYSALAIVAALLCGGIEFAAWPTLRLLHLHVASIVVFAVTMLYLLGFLWEWPFSPPSPQRGAAHALFLTSFMWLSGWCLAFAMMQNTSSPTKKPWFRMCVALGCFGVVVIAAAIVRMGLEDYKNYVKRLRRRRNRAAQENSARRPIVMTLTKDTEFTDA